MGVVGIDIGGSGVRAALVDGSDRAIAPARVALAARTVDVVLEATERAVAEAVGSTAIEAVGVGVPGFVRRRVVLASPNFPSWREVPLGALLEARLGVPVAILNDANAAALGAWEQHGGGADLVLLTLGTGVGGGVISEGRLLTGRAGTGAELGHIFVGGQRPCGCGGVGCLETWCSTTGLIRAAAEQGHEVADGAALVEAASAGQAWAAELLDEAGRHLGVGLVTLINLFAPQIVAIAGGLSQASGVLAPPAEAWLRAHGIAANVDQVSIVWLGPADGLAIAGAARAATDRLSAVDRPGGEASSRSPR